MRVGQNPLRIAKAKEFRPVVLGVVTHLPDLKNDYHKNRLEVVQTCIRTMTAGAHVDYSLIVWDNASCPELREWIQDEVKPDVFVQSFNAGKTAGRTSLSRMVPPGRVFCYSDDDMLFYDDWLRPQMEILNHFPNVSAVTGYPVRTAFRWGNENTKKWARTTHGAKLDIGRFLPVEWERDFALSVGRDPDWHVNEYTASDNDARITWDGKQAYATAHHCQFIAKSEVISRVLSFDNMAMGDERVLDEVLDGLGLRLATTQRLCRHIGNVLDDKIKQELLTFESMKE